jgi:hypothetical protein
MNDFTPTPDLADVAQRFTLSRKSVPCAICQWSPPYRAALNDDLAGDAPDLTDICRVHRITPRQLLQHVYQCCGNTANLTPAEVENSIHKFADEVVSGLRRTIGRAEQILNDLYDKTETDADGITTYPHRSIAMADAYARISKTHASTLDSIIGAAERKRLQERIDLLQSAVPQIREQRIVEIDTSKPRPTIGELLKLTENRPDPLS